MKRLRVISLRLLVIALFGTIAVISLSAQTTDCPPEKVCLSVAAAQKAVETAKELDAVKIELAAKDAAFEDLRKELNSVREKFAAASGELSGVKQNEVANRAIIELLLKNSKKRCAPFSIICL